MTRRNFVAVLVLLALAGDGIWRTAGKNYDDALTKCILFFEGQRSGKLPSSQRMNWRNDSALHDGSNIHVDLTGGYYDAGDNVKFSFPMAFTTTVLAWGVIEFGQYMGSDRGHALEAVRWGADYFLKATSVPGTVVAQVGDPYSDHDCWERPEDMDTLRTPYLVNQSHPGSEVAAEIAAALAATSIAFKKVDSSYSKTLLQRARKVFEFADKHRGSYDSSVGNAVCPFYCDFNGYMDELVWGAAWLYKATQDSVYWNYIKSNLNNLASKITRRFNGLNYVGGSFAEFGWDSKHAGINILLSRLLKNSDYSYPFVLNADKFVCSILPESPSRSVTYSPGGLLFKPGPSNLQHGTALSFLLVVYATYLEAAHRVVHCDNNVVAIPSRLVDIARGQADYILGKNPLSMSYMVGYSNKYPQRIHHRGSVLPSVDKHPKHFGCQEGHPYFESSGPNQNVLVGAIVGGPDENDQFADTRLNVSQSEPATYINAPFVGVLAYLKGLSYHINRH